MKRVPKKRLFAPIGRPQSLETMVRSVLPEDPQTREEFVEAFCSFFRDELDAAYADLEHKQHRIVRSVVSKETLPHWYAKLHETFEESRSRYGITPKPTP